MGLVVSGQRGALGNPPLFVAVEGTARIVRDKVAFADHWSSDLETCFTI
jgi:general stress protein 26